MVVREDDREAVVRERLEEYERQTRPLIEFFRSTGRRLFEVDASEGTPETVFGKILEFLQGSENTGRL